MYWESCGRSSFSHKKAAICFVKAPRLLCTERAVALALSEGQKPRDKLTSNNTANGGRYASPSASRRVRIRAQAQSYPAPFCQATFVPFPSFHIFLFHLRNCMSCWPAISLNRHARRSFIFLL